MSVKSLLVWSSPPVDSKGTLLLVDDEMEIRTIKPALLDSMGFNVISESNSSESLQAFGTSGSGIDLVLLDLIMLAEEGGITLLKQIKPNYC